VTIAGGRLELRSEPGAGATITAILPSTHREEGGRSMHDTQRAS
jgi:signal transduction histidine kinase